MAFYIKVIKSKEENNNFVFYFYEFYLPTDEYKTPKGKTRFNSKLVKGKLRVNKTNREVDVTEFAEGDSGNYAYRACSALMRSLEGGEYPEETCWAS